MTWTTFPHRWTLLDMMGFHFGAMASRTPHPAEDLRFRLWRRFSIDTRPYR